MHGSIKCFFQDEEEFPMIDDMMTVHLKISELQQNDGLRSSDRPYRLKGHENKKRKEKKKMDSLLLMRISTCKSSTHYMTSGNISIASNPCHLVLCSTRFFLKC